MEKSQDSPVFDGNPSNGDQEKQEISPYSNAPVDERAFVSPVALIPQDNDNATFSMALGIVTWISHITAPFLCFPICIAPLSMIAGIALGHLGLRDAKNMNGLRRDRAIIGLVLNYLSLIGYVLALLFGVAIVGGIGMGISKL